jgi:vacuolar-type H+-ATPase subunit I/STV1
LTENLRKDSDKNAKAVDKLRVNNTKLSTKNFDLAKTLSAKEQKIQDLERALSDRSESSKEVDEIKEHFKLLFEEYWEALRQFGTHPCPLPDNEEISELMDWMLKEFQSLPNVISEASDSAVVFSVESLLKISWSTLSIPNAANTSAI